MMDSPNITKKNSHQKVQLWDNDLVIPLLTSLKIAEGTAEYVQYSNSVSSSYSKDHNPSGLPLYRPSYPDQDAKLKCSFCDVSFSNREEQVGHYSLDWHCFNIKRVMEGLTAITHEDFHMVKEESDEESDCEDSFNSGTEDIDEKNDEDCMEQSSITKKPWIFLENSDGIIISLFRNLLLPKKVEASSEEELIQRVMASPRKLYWVIILIGGGHFSAAVFKESEAILHKTFHSYTVRAKQGGSQASADNKSSTSHPKSAGASLRRYNEKAHTQHIQEILEEWRPHIEKCDLIFYRLPISQRSFLFSGHPPLIKKGDFRARTIPFTTKKPTFKEVKRVHHLLAQIVVHAKEDYLKENLNTPLKSSAVKKETPIKKKRKKTRTDSTKITMSAKASTDTQEIAIESSSEEETDDGCDDLVTTFQSISTNELKEYDTYIENDKKIDEDSNDNLKVVHNAIYTACRTGDLYLLKSIHEFCQSQDITSVPDCLSVDLTSAIISLSDDFDFTTIRLGAIEKTLLHIAAENQQKKTIWWLLEMGCNPSEEDLKERTPYQAAPSKDTKNQFRKFMADFPDKYDYSKAKIPAPLTKEQESQRQAKVAEKKKQQKKAKQEKERQIKKEVAAKKAEEEEKERFLQMSDREKRALAAERRLISHQKEAKQSVSITQRCFLCAKDMTAEIPFEYSDFKFCSTKCVREHRNKSKST